MYLVSLLLCFSVAMFDQVHLRNRFWANVNPARTWLGSLILVAFLSYSNRVTATDDPPIYSVFLIGDAGEPDSNPVLAALKRDLEKAGARSAVVFLGDNIYPKGLPPEGHSLRPAAEQSINQQVDAVRTHPGKTFFIPGNHDWAQGRKYGYEWLLNQELYVEHLLDSLDVWHPSKGCPGPVEFSLNDSITLVIFDTQWFLHRNRKPAEGSDCEAKSLSEAAVLFQDILSRNAHKKVLVVTHHPMYTYGGHGGYFTWKDHVFPLTASKKLKWAYIPLPGLGSLYPMYRKLFGNIQDVKHPIYKQFRNTLVGLMEAHPDIVHAAGHEHALQHIEKEGVSYIVSGAGSKNNTHVKLKGAAQFVSNTVGYARLDYFANGETRLSFYTTEGDTLRQLYERSLSVKPFLRSVEDPFESYAHLSFAGEDTVSQASLKYHDRTRLHESLFGENYRKEWAAPMTFPVFDIATEQGGLRIIKRGGGHQTISLRLKTADGRHYVLRSMDKNPALTLPPELRKSIVKDIVQDGISASHPYAPLVVPPLADAAGIDHANPRIFFIPDDPRFGIYREDFANTLALFEERANDDHLQTPFIPKGSDVISSIDLYEKLRKDNDNRVDQVFVVRNRLFDMWLGDWDRHDDQCRWVEHDKKDDAKIYRPIPRDRDQVFFSGDGFLKKIAGAKWAEPALQGFHDEIAYTPSLGSFRIRWFDRYFLTGVSRQEWEQQARELKEALTDSVIEAAIRSWPDTIYQLHGEEIIRKLKNRRDKLDYYATDYYTHLAKTVDVLGSDKREWFHVQRLNENETRVTVYKISRKGNRNKVLYDRVFMTKETKEVRLFGFDGNDEFDITGDVKNSVVIRIIGGEGEDKINDTSKVRSWRKRTVVYDQKSGTKIEHEGEVRNRTSDRDSEINRYNMEEFDYNVRMPLLSFNFNPDDGIDLGGGFRFIRDGFRKEPYASSQKIKGSYLIGTNSFSLSYAGEFIDAIGKVDFLFNTHFTAPNYVNNFFGLGNESEYDSDRDITYYRMRFEEAYIAPIVRFDLGSIGNLELGMPYRFVEIDFDEDRFVADFANNEMDPEPGLFDDKRYTGALVGIHIDTRDNSVLPKSGVTFNTTANYAVGLSKNSSNSAQWNSDLTLRYALGASARTTLATRVGYQHSFGEYEIFQASRLDGFNTLRGYRRFRFAGDQSFYQQFDLRVELFEWRNLFVPTKVGLVLFHDIGRVWLSGEDSDTWHRGYGGGLFLTPYSMFAINGLLAYSEEGLLPLVKFGFYF